MPDGDGGEIFEAGADEDRLGDGPDGEAHQPKIAKKGLGIDQRSPDHHPVEIEEEAKNLPEAALQIGAIIQWSTPP